MAASMLLDKKFWNRGEPFVWAAGGALAVVALMTGTLLYVVTVNGLDVFRPHRVAQITLNDGKQMLGIPKRRDYNPDTKSFSRQFKTANRELDPQRMDFRWFDETALKRIDYPDGVYVLERRENGDFYGFLKCVSCTLISSNAPPAEQFDEALAAVRRDAADRIEPMSAQLLDRSRRLQALRYELLKVDYARKTALRADPEADTSSLDARRRALEARQAEIRAESDRLVAQQGELEAEERRHTAVFADPVGRETTIPLIDIVRAYRPNAMGLWAKTRHYLAKIGELLWANPRESNTEGGLFPAIFGTVMLIFLMAVACFPFGVLAGVYLGEYAKDGPLVRTVRVAVNNLAGIPSIVYGIFGLGFFVYGVGGWIDRAVYPERVDAGISTFGTGGILWASLTLGLLTIPVVIVSTEEALRVIPQGIRESSMALGSTKLQTLVRVLLPMASPGMMTGFILAMARAAGEVAPLMITGVVKLAPDLPLDGWFPYFHLERKFMHLGFHIFDIGFQSPNVEASKPMVYATTLLLLLIVASMSGTAILLRNRMRKQFQSRSI